MDGVAKRGNYSHSHVPNYKKTFKIYLYSTPHYY